nr:MAG TPA: hypothetical protein [Bacteriophage sp.]
MPGGEIGYFRLRLTPYQILQPCGLNIQARIPSVDYRYRTICTVRLHVLPCLHLNN